MKNLMSYGVAALLLVTGMTTATAQAPPGDHREKPAPAAGKPPAHPQPPPGNNRPPDRQPERPPARPRPPADRAPPRRPVVVNRTVVVKRPVVVDRPVVVNHPVVVNRPVVVGRPAGPGPGRFRLGGYQRPPGYFYRSWGVGLALPSFFRAQTYWLNDYGGYQLPPPRYGAHWVRVDDDALLVVDSTGEIIDVRHDIFY